MNMNTKRFTWLKKDGYAPQIVITDSLTEKDLTPTDCYELLNELAEENEQLKKQMQRLYNENERLKEYNNKLMKQPLLFDVQTIPNTMKIIEANTQLNEENEQLKQLLDYADDLIQSHLSEHYIQQWRNFKTGNDC